MAALTSASEATPAAARAGRGAAWGAGASALLALGSLARFAHPDYAVDDAWISFRVARTWLERGLLTYDATRPPVEGTTNLAWTFLSAGWIALFGQTDPIVVARLLGGMLHVLAAVLVALLAARLAGGGPRRSAAAAAISGGLFALSGALAYHALSGLETALWVALWLGAAHAFLSALEGRAGAAWTCGILLGLLAATRPEGVLAGGLVVGAAALRREGRRAAWRIAVPFGVAVLGVETLRAWHYHALVPNTFHAKPPDPRAGLAYLSSYAVYGLGLVGPVAAWWSVRERPAARAIAAVAAILAAGTVWTGGDWMAGHRRLELTTVSLLALVGAGVALARGRQRLVAAAAAAAMACGEVAMAAAGHDGEAVAADAWYAVARLADATPPIRQVALADIGRFGWRFRGSIYDLGGLTDAHLARRGRGSGAPGTAPAPAWDEAYFRARRPELVLIVADATLDRPLSGPLGGLRPIDLGAFGSIAVHGGYRYRGSVPTGGGHLLVFARDDVELPEATWGPPRPLGLRERLRELARRRPRD